MKVSAMITTYNHAPFIEAAVNSALMQDVAGGYEIVITDDCSTDDTPGIVERLQAQHPDRIRLLPSDRNSSHSAVIARGMAAAEGEYIALLDGDDYWTSPSKLQRQIDFLDGHEDCAICFHNAMVIYEDGSAPAHPFYSIEPKHRISATTPCPVSTLADLVGGNFLLTNAVVFRRGLVQKLPDWYFDLILADWPLHVLNAEHGDIGYLDELLSAYRVHGSGHWSSRLSYYSDPEDVESLIDVYDAINSHLGFRYDGIVKQRTGYLAAESARLLTTAGRHTDAAPLARRALSDAPQLHRGRRRLALQVMARPRVARAYVRGRKAASRLIARGRPVAVSLA